MISISDPIKNPKQIGYYLAMAQVSYYANLYEDSGRWAGKGTGLLGVKGPVTQKVLQNLLDGYGPDGETQLVQNAGNPNRQRAIDMVATPPKSVSVFWAMAEPVEQATLLRLHDEAVNAAREYLEEQAGLTRRGQGGRKIEPAAMIFACFDHYTSRANDPNLHTHLLAMNVVVREDGTTGALHNEELFVHRAKADMIYKVHLALGLMLELGLPVEEEGHGFRIVGVPKEVCDVFSKRRAEILDFLEENGFSGAAAASIAAIATRPAKQHIPREELFAEWHRIGRALGWGAGRGGQAQPGKEGSGTHLKERAPPGTRGGIPAARQPVIRVRKGQTFEGEPSRARGKADRHRSVEAVRRQGAVGSGRIRPQPFKRFPGASRTDKVRTWAHVEFPRRA